MPPSDLTIDYLKHHPDCIPQLARNAYNEWKLYYDQAGATPESTVAHFARRANIDSLPLALVAIYQGRVIGTGCLKVGDLEERPHLTPWLGGMLVEPEHRGRGVGTALIHRLVDEARRLQIKRLYLWTPSAEALYAKLGWVRLEQLLHCDQEITVMQRDL